MPFVSSVTVAGLSRADGATGRTVTLTRVTSTKNGFILRELGVLPSNQQSLTHSTWESKGASGMMIRHQSTEWVWNYSDPSATDPNALAGRVIWNRNGLHIPANCPTNVRKDIRAQMSVMANNSAGSVGLNLVYDPVISEAYPF